MLRTASKIWISFIDNLIPLERNTSSSCKWKITEELKKNGFENFDIDMDSSILSFEDNVNPYTIIRIVSNIGYRIKEVEKW